MFNKWRELPEELRAAASVAVEDVLKVEREERVLLITNPRREVSLISEALYDAFLERGARPVLIYQEPKSQMDFADREVISALSASPDVIISISQSKIGKDRDAILKPYVLDGKSYDHIFDYLRRGTGKARSFWSPGITVDMFCRTVPIDYPDLKRNCAALKALLDGSEEIHLTSSLGTDLTIGIRNRLAMVDDGDFSSGGKGGNLPAGEVFISPELNTARGKIVFDGCIATHSRVILIENPIEVQVEEGFVTRISGAWEADLLAETVTLGEKNAFELEKQGKLAQGSAERYARNSRNLGEFGIGLNRKATLIGNMLEDEKVFGTCHIAIGSNYDEDAPALIHLDGVIKKPTVTFIREDGTEAELMENGTHKGLLS
ncbi:MAG TPA: aminopeptidase [Spirochaetia bacterium]|nr:aminopeptidase [Spirochaetia bacterium]